MKLFLAPMEGVIDSVLRSFLTSFGGVDQCVTEFFRVNRGQILPDHVFLRECPELKNQAHTPCGTPVWVQLLGGDPDSLAENAKVAARLGAPGIDINFGCPAKTVNRNDGGATLLQYPHRIFDILTAVRKAVDPLPVTAKIRLGFDRPEACIENAQAAEAAGVRTLTVHCRTRSDMYKPPAFWEWIPKIRAVSRLNIVANGEIWNLEDFKKCRSITGCDHFMIGRGALSDPLIFRKIKDQMQMDSWPELRKAFLPFFDENAVAKSKFFAIARTKQWLNMASKTQPECAQFFHSVKGIKNAEEFRDRLRLIQH